MAYSLIAHGSQLFFLHLIHEKYFRAAMGKLGAYLVRDYDAVVHDSIPYCLLPARTQANPRLYLFCQDMDGDLYARYRVPG